MATGTAAETASVCDLPQYTNTFTNFSVVQVGFQTAESSFHVDHIPLKQCFDVHAE